MVVAAGSLDPFIEKAGARIPAGLVTLFFVPNIGGVTGTCYLLLHYFVRARDVMAAMAEQEHERSERSLLNVLPASIAERLKGGESVIADRVLEVGVLFARSAGRST